ncbi:MAG: indole-3-glycerol phosphate synthase [Deltaproteobacteria bacterium RIFOXYD12_FULL_55_16]|nr:MAG: indole-3-glycerol phosphate synthase [Deltaproteobacteria bacterium RIFOXYD12_FULL_55_16]
MILDTIVARKKEEVAALKARGLVAPELEIPPPRGFIRALTDFAGVAVIAEAKKASPSKGVIRADFDPVAIARCYRTGGAQALSVLTDVDFFQGSLAYLPAVRAAVALPVLRKDFIIDPLQIKEARAYGADAILLIAAILETSQIEEYQALALELGMDALVEVHDEAEVAKAVAAGSRLIGVNNRDLRDFSLDLNTTFRLQKMIPAEIPLVSESGIRDHHDMLRLAAHGVKAALVGETLMRAADPAKALRVLVAGEQG